MLITVDLSLTQISLAQFRYDSQVLPFITVSGISGDHAFMKLADWTYTEVFDGENLLIPFNRSLKNVPVKVRGMVDTAPTTSSNVATGTAANIFRYVERTSGEDWGGAHYPTPLSSDFCSIQAKITSLSLSCGISLQDSSGAVSHHYLAGTIAHSMAFGYAGQGQIREFGLLPASAAYFKYELEDLAMIELRDGIIRYYLVKPDGRMVLLRTTRSKLTSDPYAEVMVFSTGSEMTNVLVGSDDEFEPSGQLETVGVLENFQDWFNDFVKESTADEIQMADNLTQHTFANHKKRLRVLTANLNRRSKEDRDAFDAFYEYHGMEIPFIFVDKAKTDEDGEPTEFWAKFSSPFSDKTRASCISSLAATITEDYRNDYIPRQIDEFGPGVPTITTFAESSPTSISLAFSQCFDNVVNYQFRIFVTPIIISDTDQPFEALGETRYISQTYKYIYDAGLVREFDITDLTTGDTYTIQVRSVDFAGRASAWSTAASETL